MFGTRKYVVTLAISCLCLLSASCIGILYAFGIVPARGIMAVVPPVFVGIAGWSLIAVRRQWGDLFNPWGMFLIACVMFNGGHIVLQALSISVYDPYAPSFSEHIYAQVYLLVTISTIALLVGGLCAGKPSSGPSLRPEGRRGEQRTRLLWLVGWGMVLLAAWPTAASIGEGIKTVMAEGYLSLYSRTAETGMDAAGHKLAALLVPGLMFVLAGSQKERMWGRRVSLIILALSSGGLLFQGFRGAAVMPVLAYGWLWHKTVRPLRPGVVMAGGAILLLVVFPIVKQMRNLSGPDRLSLDRLVEEYVSIDNPAVAIVNEMGRSMNTIGYSLELVPGEREYDYGMGYLYSALTIVPNIGADLHPAAKKVQYGKWLTAQVNPWLADRGGGVGFSFVAEAYVNFGWAGAPLFIMLVGFLLAQLLNWSIRDNDAGRLAVMAAFMAFLLMYARGEFISIVRPLVWFSLGPYVLVNIARGAIARSRIASRRFPVEG